MQSDNISQIGAGDSPHSVHAFNRPAHSPLPFPRLYRAHIGADDRNPERTAFVEAASHGDAIRKIANAVAAFEGRLPDRIVERIYNVASARELIDDGVSEDMALRLFEVGWCGESVLFVQEPLFLLAAPGKLIRKWAQISSAVCETAVQS